MALQKILFNLVSSVGQEKKNSESYEELNLIRPLDSTLWCSTTEPQRLYGEKGPLQSSYMTHILHTAKISKVNIVMFCK